MDNKPEIKQVKREFSFAFFLGSVMGTLVTMPVFLIVLIVRSVFRLIASKIKEATASESVVRKSKEIALEKVEDKFEVARCFSHVAGEGWKVSILGYENKFIRILKTPRERFHFQRAREAFDREQMIPFTMELAVANNLPFNITGCQRFTKNELSGLKLKVPVHNIVDAEPLDSKPTQQIQSLPSNPENGDSAAEHKKIEEAFGRIQSAGIVEITPEGKAPYKIFSINILSKDGQTKEFRGKDLSEKFQAREFELGDTVKLICSKVDFTVGKVKRSKNVFVIHVIQKGQQ